MSDREKVIKGLEQFRADMKAFCGNHADWERFDAGLSMLKEQEAEIEQLNRFVNGFSRDAMPVVRCRDCRHRDPEDKKCDCGHTIQWQLPRPDDWFCADGVAKDINVPDKEGR